ncbi:M56 family metallopeptidase [Pontibacter ummariensis]|nr:M56 family metallopeptidase [Pontibacter ummariensis]
MILYLLKMNAALLLFYLTYYLVLRRLTFYNLNRLFLIFAILFSAVFPLVDLSEALPGPEGLPGNIYGIMPAWQAKTATATATQTPLFDPWQLALAAFWSGAAFALLRLLIQLLSLGRLHARSSSDELFGFAFRSTGEDINPFSFWQSIYLNPGKHRQEELLPILRHEQAHVQEWHTLDVLLAEAGTMLSWFNPGAWLLRQAIKQNLEFIADRKVLQSGLDSKVYQYSLVRISSLSQGLSLTNNFNFLTIKKRIAMMNKAPSARAHLLRFLVVIPISLTLLLAFNSLAQRQANELTQDPNVKRVISEVKGNDDAAYTYLAPNILIKSDLDLEYARWIRPNTLIVKPRSGKEETYQLDSAPSLAEAKEKYGVRFTDAEDESKPLLKGKARQATEKQEAASAVTQSQDESFIFKLDEVEYYRNEANWPKDYKDFLERNPEVKQIGWKFNNREEYNLESLVIYLKSGATEVYHYNGSMQIPAAESKYGTLPSLPPPPPPVRAN